MLLLACGFVDGRAIVANWNVDREIAEPAKELDYVYLVSLGPSALPAMERLRPTPVAKPTINDTYESIVGGMLVSPSPFYLEARTKDIRQELASSQSDWRSWTLRYALLPP